MDAARLGLAIRALRRRAGWTQAELGRRARTSATSVSRLERGRAAGLSVRALERVVEALGARLTIRVLWQGEGLDRLLDVDHASIVELVCRDLVATGWEIVPEATFQVGSERGSIDILGFHRSAGILLVIEVKTVVPDLQSMLSTMDRKVRLAPRVALGRGWQPRTVARILVFPHDRTARRRVASFGATFDAAVPARTTEVKRWLRAPAGAIAGILFVPFARQARTRHRVGVPRSRPTHGPGRRS